MRINWTFRPHVNGAPVEAIASPTPAPTHELEAVPVEVLDLTESDRLIESLYQQLQEAEAEANAAFKNATSKYFDLGIELLKRRPEFPRGTWLAWLAERGIDERYAQRSMQIAKHFGEKSDSLSDMSIEDALRQIQKKLPSVDGFTFEEVKAEYEAIAPNCFKFHKGGAHPYSFEISGFTSCFDSLTQAMSRLPALKEKYARVAGYQAVDEPEDAAIGQPATDELPSVEQMAGILAEQPTTPAQPAVPDQQQPIAPATPIPSQRLERVANDFYPTRDSAILVQELNKIVDIRGQVFSCCAGDGEIARQFEGAIANDLHEYPGFTCDYYLDATEAESWQAFDADGGFDWVVENPTFRLASTILPHALDHARVGVAFLLRLSYAEPCDDRAEWLQKHTDQMVAQISFSPRPRFRSDTTGTDPLTVAWFVWRKDWSWKKLGIVCPFQFVHDWRA